MAKSAKFGKILKNLDRKTHREATFEKKKPKFLVIFVLKFVNQVSLLYSEVKKVTKKSPFLVTFSITSKIVVFYFF